MTEVEFSRRRARAERESFVIQRTERGFRVYRPGDPARNYLVSGEPDAYACTCPDFERHRDDPDWCCKHVLAVAERTGASHAGNGNARSYAQAAEDRNDTPSPTTMLLKRSVSPDGRIDSLSVELSCPVEGLLQAEVLGRATSALDLQSEIVEEFLGRTRSGNGNPREERESSRTVEARLLRISGIDTRYGRRLCINVEVNGETLKLFGSRKQLAEAIEAAGYSDRAQRVEEGLRLDLPCRVTTKPSDDGRYINVEQVFPADRRPSR